jgi:hypothetical protein
MSADPRAARERHTRRPASGLATPGLAVSWIKSTSLLIPHSIDSWLDLNVLCGVHSVVRGTHVQIFLLAPPL